MEIAKIQNKDEWDRFVESVKGNPLQLWGWGQVKHLHGWDVERVQVLRDGQVVGGAQILYRSVPFPLNSFAYIPRGPLVVDDRISLEDLMNVLADHVKKTRKSVALSVEPEVIGTDRPAGWVQSENHILTPSTIYLNLDLGAEQLQANMAKSARRSIRKATEVLDIRRAETRADLQVCLDILHEASDRAGFNVHTDQYYIDVFEELGDNAAVFIAEYEGQPVAFDWLATTPGCTYDLYGSANTLGRKLRANYGITWHSIVYSMEQGIDHFDFGGMVEGGVSTFKNYWDESPTTFVGTWDKPLSPFYPVWNKGLPAAKKLWHSLHRG